MDQENIREFISEDIEASWNNCLKIWIKHRRIEDFPRSMRLPRYTPSFGKRLGLEFARTFKHQYQFIIEKLYSEDKIETLCAFECLEFICWEYGIDNVPLEIYEITLPIPDKIMKEIDGDLDAPGFEGDKIGALLKYKFTEEYEKSEEK
jgi:hypothetical protein